LADPAAGLAGQDVLVYVLAEHEFASEHFTALQLARYVVRIQDRWLEQHPSARHLPPILPFVFHHGERPWTAPRRLRDLIAVPAGAPACAAALRELQLEQAFVLLDVAAMDEAAIAGATRTAGVDLTLRFLQLLRWLRPVAAHHELLRWSQRVAPLQREPRGEAVLRALFSWYLAATPHDPAPLLEAMTKIREENEPMRTALDWWLEMGEQRGAERVRQAGALDAQRRLLRDQLTIRFGALTTDVLARIEAADPRRLEPRGRRVLTEASLAAVLVEE
jgi:hypothetical protein